MIKILFTILLFSFAALQARPGSLEEISRAIYALQKDTSVAEMLRIVSFIETDLHTYIAKKRYYLPTELTTLPCAIEYDPVTESCFIHLETKKKNTIGSGGEKYVTKSIFYKGTASEIVARCKQTAKGSSEIEIIRHLQGLEGIVSMYAATRYMESSRPVETLFCKWYKPGALGGVGGCLNHGMQFTLPEKVGIACDLLVGLENIHAHGVLHGDITAANCFVHISKDPITNGRKIEAVIGDFGKSRWGQEITPDLYASDIFDMGCALYKLYYNKTVPWQSEEYLAGFAGSPAAVIEAIVKKRRDEILNKKSKTNTLSIEEEFELTILYMLHEDHAKRPDSTILKNNFIVLSNKLRG